MPFLPVCKDIAITFAPAVTTRFILGRYIGGSDFLLVFV